MMVSNMTLIIYSFKIDVTHPVSIDYYGNDKLQKYLTMK